MARIVLDPDEVNQERVVTMTDGTTVELGDCDKKTLDRIATQLFVNRSAYAHAYRCEDEALGDRVARGQVGISAVSPLYLRVLALQARARPSGGRGANQVDLRGLLATTTWTSGSGKAQLLGDMTPTHRQNLLRWFERASDELEERWNDADDLTDAERALVADGEPWIAGTPVYRRLAQLIASQTARDEAMDQARQAARHVEFERSGHWPEK